jgi:hypothetical protein
MIEYANLPCKTPIEMSPLSPFQISLSPGCGDERVADDGDSDAPAADHWMQVLRDF